MTIYHTEITLNVYFFCIACCYSDNRNCCGVYMLAGLE